MNLSPAPTGDGAVLAAHGPPRLVLLAQTRRGYGNLAQWISVARRRAPKGQYQAHAGDLEGRVPHAPFLAGLPGCFAILLPQPGQAFESVHAQAMWLKTWFGAERAFIALQRLLGPWDDQLQDTVARVAQATGLTVVAAGDVLMHARSRKPLQDVLTATRLRLPVASCGHSLQPNAEAHLRARAA
jgi:error-prone DNA polymerase